MSKKILYIDCGMGAAGDMLTSALLEILCQAEELKDGRRTEPQKVEAFVQRFHQAGIPGVEMRVCLDEKNGITGTHVHIYVHGEEEGYEHNHDHGSDDGHHHDHDYGHESGHGHHHDHPHDHGHGHHHSHRTMKEIEALISRLQVTEEVKADVMAVYRLIAEAEGQVHGKPAGEVHFHEVGTLDAVADITAVCMLIQEIGAERIVASPIATGYGSVLCAHGVLPVPAPATALLLQGLPSYSGEVEGELCTPTGAALLRHFVTDFSRMPVMKTEAVGYGIGTKDFPKANCLRVFLGAETDLAPTEIGDDNEQECFLHENSDKTPKTVTELSCNVDDMTGEEMGFASERLFAAGALDVYVVPIYMKKNRPGLLIRVMCRNEDRDAMVRTIFRYTTTIGVRETVMNRYVLHRTLSEEEKNGRIVHNKKAVGFEVARNKWEYEDLAAIAREQECSLKEAADLLNRNSKECRKEL